jgi:hypothetical protein
MRRATLLALTALAPLAPLANGQITLPNDFESPSNSLAALSSYFGGVADFGTRPSTAAIHSGNSLEVWANFQHDNFFRIAGFTVGSFTISRPALSVPANAAFFSVTIRSPESGQLAMIVNLVEDDDADGVASFDSDDNWESLPLMLLPGTNVYNIPFSALTLANAGSGNDTQNFTTTPAMSVRLTFESRTTFPGGIIERPISFRIDHLGLYATPQTIPAPQCVADTDNGTGSGTPDGGVTIDDLLYYLAVYEAGAARADVDNGSNTGTPDGGVTIDDLLYFLLRYEAGC